MSLDESGKEVYRIELDDAAERDFDKLTPKAKGQIAKLINTLAADPRAGNARELVGFKGVYRKRTGDYRVVYTIEEDVLLSYCCRRRTKKRHLRTDKATYKISKQKGVLAEQHPFLFTNSFFGKFLNRVSQPEYP